MSDHKAPRDHVLSTAAYDNLKRLAQIGLPGLATFYFTISQIWGFPLTEEVVGTIAAVDTLLGLFLGYSSKSYHNSKAKYDGELILTEDEDGFKSPRLVLETDLYEVEKNHGDIVFKVKSEKA